MTSSCRAFSSLLGLPWLAGRVVGHETAFCATFDTDPFESGWAARTEQDGATLSADSIMPISKPRSLLVSTPANTTSASAFFKGIVARRKTRISMTTGVMPIGASPKTTAFQLEFGPDEIEVRAGSPPEFRQTISGDVDEIVTSMDLPTPSAPISIRARTS